MLWRKLTTIFCTDVEDSQKPLRGALREPAQNARGTAGSAHAAGARIACAAAGARGGSLQHPACGRASPRAQQSRRGREHPVHAPRRAAGSTSIVDSLLRRCEHHPIVDSTLPAADHIPSSLLRSSRLNDERWQMITSRLAFPIYELALFPQKIHFCVGFTRIVGSRHAIFDPSQDFFSVSRSAPFSI